jgi:hypothetical protein
MRPILRKRIAPGWCGWFVVTAFLSLFGPLAAADEPPRTRAVPADALAVVHIRLADIWKSDALADLHRILEKAGPDALRVFDQRFVPAPSSIDRLTVVIGAPMAGAPPVTCMLETSKAFDADKFAKTTCPSLEEAKAGGTTSEIAPA